MEFPIPAASTTVAVLRHIQEDLGQPVGEMLEICERWLWEDGSEAGASSGQLDALNARVQRVSLRVNRIAKTRGGEANVVKLLRRVGQELRSDLRPMLLEIGDGVADCRERVRALPEAQGSGLLRDLDQLEAAAAVLESRLHVRFDTSDGPGAESAAAMRLKVSLEPSDGQIEGHVLLVDDQPVVQAVVGGALRAMGCSVTAVSSGEEAMRALEGGDIDTILLDLLLPGMSGQDVLRRLAESRELRGIPVVVLTGVSDPAAVALCIELGATDVLDKAHHPLLLRARVQNCIARKRARDREVAWYWEAVAQRKRSDALLRAILPQQVVRELKATGRTRAREHEQVAVLFCDIAGFTQFCACHDADTIRDALQEITELYEELCSAFQLEKIKTIGDAFMAAAGLQEGAVDPCEAAVRCGLEMIKVAPTLSAKWHVRVAIHVGPLIAGVVGRQKYQYDIWGDTVNTAARIEGLTPVGELWVSEEVRAKLGAEWLIEGVGTFELRGKGASELFRVNGKGSTPPEGLAALHTSDGALAR